MSEYWYWQYISRWHGGEWEKEQISVFPQYTVHLEQSGTTPEKTTTAGIKYWCLRLNNYIMQSNPKCSFLYLASNGPNHRWPLVAMPCPSSPATTLNVKKVATALQDINKHTNLSDSPTNYCCVPLCRPSPGSLLFTYPCHQNVSIFCHFPVDQFFISICNFHPLIIWGIICIWT